MQSYTAGSSVLLALLISAGIAAAQTGTTTPTFESTLTTGMVGWVPATQTAQLTVLNLNSFVFGGLTPGTGSTSTTPATTCPVELDFVDAQNNVLKSLQVTNVAPGTAASLTLKLSDLTAAATPVLRADIRGVVKSNPIVGGPIVNGTMIPANPSACSVFPTLELFDTATGVTQVFSSETRRFGTALLVPLTSVPPPGPVVN
jgi:hypothetical protein